MNTDYNIPTWDDYFLNIAKVVSTRSKDPNTKVGAVIVDRNNKIIGTGYNGMPTGIPSSEIYWERDNENPIENKYMYVVHAEANAIINSLAPTNGNKLYVTDFPCNECAKLIIQSGITDVYYLRNKYPDSDSTKVSKKILEASNIKIHHIHLNNTFYVAYKDINTDMEYDGTIIYAKDKEEAKRIFIRDKNIPVTSNNNNFEIVITIEDEQK